MNPHWMKLSQTAAQAASKGNYDCAEATWLAALQETEDFAVNDQRLVQTLEGLSEAYRKQGKFRQAEKPARRLLEISRQVHGNDHIKSAVASHNLAIIYHMQQKYGQAEPLYKHALTIKTKILGAADPDVIQLLYSYSELLKKTYRDDQAENLTRCARASEDMSVNAKASRLAASMVRQAPVWSQNPATREVSHMVSANQSVNSSNYDQVDGFDGRSSAQVTAELKRQETWEELKESAEAALAAGQVDRALAIWNRAILTAEKFESTDSRLAQSLDRVGEIFFNSEKFEPAEVVWWRALQIKQGVLGNFHPAVARTTNYLAKLHYLLGRYAEAESFALKCLNIYQRSLGREHPTVATCMHNLASLYHIQGRYAEAEERYKGALAIRKKVLGLQNPETLSLTKSYADLLKTLGRDAEAHHLNSTSNGFVSGSWKALVVPDDQALTKTADICMFCGVTLRGLNSCSACQTHRGKPF
ncbi:MAG: tetratricopeptide repeat protein [Candidatus Melainabacteria bacterium]|nr:tetratricopeptide repeat protein [Candidatus Melainabacteria bacterium]